MVVNTKVTAKTTPEKVLSLIRQISINPKSRFTLKVGGITLMDTNEILLKLSMYKTLNSDEVMILNII